MTADLQTQVQDVLDELVGSGAERGLQVAVFHQGRQVVDAVAGLADPATGRPVTSATPFYNFSICKAAAATVAHRLVDRGLFTYDTPIVDLWPEFGAHGKRAVTIRQALNHSAGVPGIPLDTTIEDLCDWDRMCAAIAAEELWWEPGTKIGYHAYTFGYIMGEVVRRATGKRISQLLIEEVSGPLGVANELYFGMPEPEQHRLAKLEDAAAPAAMPEMPADLPMFKAAPPALFPNATLGNRPDVLAADIPAGGKTSARAMARMYAALVSGLDGVRLLSPERVREVSAVSMAGQDQVFGMPAAWGLGYSLGAPGAEPRDPETAFGVGGVGGSFAYGDTATGIAFALTKNRLHPDFNTVARVIALVTAAVATRATPISRG
jgi:CubicO group peptidase (beta-lactamase class C family)